jgi:hypothetical protein
MSTKVFTSNADVTYVSGHTVNKIETVAFAERFAGKMYFPVPVQNPDKRYKSWGKCNA